jgi:hypothetical protein
MAQVSDLQGRCRSRYYYVRADFLKLRRAGGNRPKRAGPASVIKTEHRYRRAMCRRREWTGYVIPYSHRNVSGLVDRYFKIRRSRNDVARSGGQVNLRRQNQAKIETSQCE